MAKSRGFKMSKMSVPTRRIRIPPTLYAGSVMLMVLALNGCQPYRETVYTPTPKAGALPVVSYKKTFQQRGFYYTVAKGDTVAKLSRTYGVEPAQIIRINKLDSNGTVEIGQSLFIPASGAAPASKAPSSASIREPIRLKGGALRFLIPLKGESSVKNNQLYITAKDSFTVSAAEDGMVTYAGYLKGYGETLIVEHRQGFSTVYANLSSRLKATNQRVVKGESIAEVARSGNGKVLQFQLRKSGEMVNPIKYFN